MIPQIIYRELDLLEIKYKNDMPLEKFSSFRIGGRSELSIFPDSREQLMRTVSLLRENRVGFHIVGKGSNILFGDGTVEDALIFTEGLSVIRVEGEKMFAEAGASLASLATVAAEHGLTGLEFAKGIPGTVGGALFMNAGAYGGEMSQITVSSEAYDAENNSLLEITDHNFGYRKSLYMEEGNLICLGGCFLLKKGDIKEINEKMRDFAERRREKQPLNYPSAGSYFKRPEGHFAGKLIEDAGLKGYRVGDAAVSEKHGGFIVNLGHATASDVQMLEAHVRETVYTRFGVTLEREVRIIK